MHSNEEVSLKAVSRLVAARRLMRPHRHWDDGRVGEERQLLCGLDVVGGETQQHLADANKVHDLGDAKEWCDDQCPAASALHEGTGTLPGKDFSVMSRERVDKSR